MPEENHMWQKAMRNEIIKNISRVQLKYKALLTEKKKEEKRKYGKVQREMIYKETPNSKLTLKRIK